MKTIRKMKNLHYTEYADDDLANVLNGEVSPACPYFIEVCKQMAEESESEE